MPPTKIDASSRKASVFGLLTPAELAIELDVAEHTLANWRAAGKGPPYFKKGGKIGYRDVDVRKWLESRIRRTSDADQGKRRELALPILGERPDVSGNTGLVATERNRNVATRKEAKTRELSQRPRPRVKARGEVLQ